MEKVFQNLVAKTQVHGIEQIRKSSNKLAKLFWCSVFVIASVITIGQIFALTTTFLADAILNTYIFENILTAERFENTFRPVYCAQDWLDEDLVREHNVSIIALMVAMKELKTVDTYVVTRLVKMLNDTTNSTVTIKQLVPREYTSYFIPAAIKYNFSSAIANELLQTELSRQNCSSPLDLLIKVAKNLIADRPYVAQMGSLCQYAKLHSQNVSDEAVPMESNQHGFSVQHYLKEPQDTKPLFHLFLNPQNPENVENENFDFLVHPLVESYMFSNPKNYREVRTAEKVEFKDKKSSFISYILVVNARQRKRIVTRNHKCRNYNNVPFSERTSLISFCNIACATDLYNADKGEFDYKRAANIYARIIDTNVFVFNDTTNDYEIKRSNNTDSRKKCKNNCNYIQPACVESQVSMTIGYVDDISHLWDIDLGSLLGNNSWFRQRTFNFNLEQYIIIEESKKMNFFDYIGAVGGSLGMFMGASMISLLQLSINCCRCVRYAPIYHVV